jgi:hypothetical protein
LLTTERLLTLPRCSMMPRKVVWWMGGNLRNLPRRAEKLLLMWDSACSARPALFISFQNLPLFSVYLTRSG